MASISSSLCIPQTCVLAPGRAKQLSLMDKLETRNPMSRPAGFLGKGHGAAVPVLPVMPAPLPGACVIPPWLDLCFELLV